MRSAEEWAKIVKKIISIACVLFALGGKVSAATLADAQTSVAALYQQCLVRLPDYPAAQGWVDALVSGAWTFAQVRDGICNSPEAVAFKQLPSQTIQTVGIDPPSVIIQGMVGRQLFNTGSFPCDGSLRSSDLVNRSGHTLAIHKILHWHGMNLGTSADFDSRVIRLSDASEVSTFPDDHYGAPVGHATSLVLDFAVPFLLAAGDGLRLNAVCYNPSTQGHVQVFVWWEWGP